MLPPKKTKSASSHWRHPGNVLHGHHWRKWWWGWHRQMEEQSVAAQSAVLVIFGTRLTPMAMGVGCGGSSLCVFFFPIIHNFQRAKETNLYKEFWKWNSVLRANCFRFVSVQQLVSIFCVLWLIFFLCQRRFKLWCWRKGCCTPVDLFLIRSEPSLGVEKASHSPWDKQRKEELHKVSPGWLSLLQKKRND